jgi:ABC-type multidrug transport system ATPase subunit
MSERILRALMQLFAIIAKVDDVSDSEADKKIESTEGKVIVESILRSELSSNFVKQYLDLFDEQLQLLRASTKRKDGAKKRTSVQSVKVLRICAQINKELTQIQKIIVLVRIFEFIKVNNTRIITEQELDFAETVADSFNVEKSNYEIIKKFIINEVEDKIDNSKILYISDQKQGFEFSKAVGLRNLDGEIRVLRLDNLNILFFRYLGNDEISFNGQVLNSDRAQIFSNGASIKPAKSSPIYYSDVISTFLQDEIQENIVFKLNKVEYVFKNGIQGLHKTNFTAESGNLIGIMGGSGTGKSTFLNILNGNSSPTRGKITLNGIDIHNEKDKIQGIIGFISQDDLLIEELSVYQNLYYNAQLSFKNLSDYEIDKRVLEVLTSLGLFEARSLKVGGPLDKTISGGQRKRLNIALELIREPSVLFVDEPTSGLSSRDSENIMDLLKELALKGKLVFVVIHQPSSEIFKMFDRLFILDQGGYPIYDGHPIDAVVYFKVQVKHVNAHDRECYACGNVNPEQIFNIIESKIVDEFGNLTETRKTSPEEWNQLYLSTCKKPNVKKSSDEVIVKSSRPSMLRQFVVFFKRDILSKLANKQYVAINFLEGPLLAVLLAFFVKYFDISGEKNFQYVYSLFHNENIPQYLFISVIISLFMGLTVSAEEIIKDKHILKRESFLNLSRTSYLLSKVSIMFLISAIQSISLVLIGNWILENDGMTINHWLILFSASCFANMLGLIVSSTFNSVKVIYIVVPLLIIPQLLFSGVIVKFDKLHPFFAEQKEVPWIGNVMTSRWAYEAIAVTQYLDNPLEIKLFEDKKIKAESGWKRDYWLPEIQHQIKILEDDQSDVIQKKSAKIVLINEIIKEENIWGNLDCKDCEAEIEAQKGFHNLRIFLDVLKKQYNINYNKSAERIDEEIQKIGTTNYELLQLKYENDNLSDLVKNRSEFNKLLIFNNEMVQKSDPIYQDTRFDRFLDAPFYSSQKMVFGILTSTFWANLFFIWAMTVGFYFLLYLNIFKWFFSLSQFGKNKA